MTGLFVCVMIGRLINAAMFFDHIPTDSATLTKWASFSLISPLLTRCAELGVALLIDDQGYEVSLSVTTGLGAVILLVSFWVADALSMDMMPSRRPATLALPQVHL